jgi:hypothetical protein
MAQREDKGRQKGKEREAVVHTLHTPEYLRKRATDLSQQEVCVIVPITAFKSIKGKVA